MPMGVAAHTQHRAERGRTPSTKTPVTVRNSTSSPLDREWIHQRLGFKLGKFAARIDRADISVADEGGPTGAPALRATIQLTVPRHDPIVVTSRATTAQSAVGGALQAAERAMRRAFERVSSVKRRRSTK